MGLNLSIQGIDYTRESNLEGISLELGFNNDNTFESAVSSEITLSGVACDVVKNRFFNCNVAQDNSLDATLVYDKCGGVSIPLNITGEGVTDCPNTCECQVNLTSLDGDKECYRILNSTFITFDGFLDYKTHPRVHYCTQPTIFSGLLWFLAIAIMPLLILVVALLNVLEAICGALEGLLNLLLRIPLIRNIVVNNLPPILQQYYDGQTFQLDICPDVIDIDELLGVIRELLTGCGNYTPTYLVRDIFDYHSGRCGMTFKSSIFNDPASKYYNTTLWCQPNEKGVDRNDDFNVVLGNEPNMTVIAFAEQLKETFPCTDYRIVDGCFYFEREEFFYEPKKEVYNLIDNPTDDTCYTYNSEELCIGTVYQYCRDESESQGNRLMSVYNDYVSYGNGDSLTELCEVNSPFAPARFMFDCETGDKTGFFDLDFIIDWYRQTGSFQTGIGFIDNFNQEVNNPRECDLILDGHTANKCKLLILEGGFDPLDAKVERIKKGEFRGQDIHYYNAPLYYDKSMESGVPELINCFGDCLDPANKKDLYEMPDVTVALTCNVLECLLGNKLGNYITTHYGKAFYETATIDFDKCRVTFGGLRVYCD